MEAKAPTCTESGPAYYHCENCGKNFYDDKLRRLPEELTLFIPI